MFFKRLFKKKPSNEDADLIRQYKQTLDTAFAGELYGRYTHLVYGVCLKYLRNEEDSKDAVMQIFEKLLIELKHHEVSNFKSWLHVLAKNHCLMWLRSARVRHEKSIITYDVKPDMENEEYLHPLGEEENGTLEENLVALEKGIQELPVEQKRCIELFYLQQKCYKEITEITGYDLKKVKSYIQNGKRNLKIYLDKDHE
ncbi:sigma-70 family RNA polymerase sigma factor [Rhodocytophaga aerolata]|uniref:Sigma-70 family RNA polymerase sigma factor n=1 Tax=Rhodocytophaga aerolata TaxID=455078 RepID=A0ABT8RBE7_9BACT|nr:sigma-70 family RNA polymerase sigma factor [Rhodocytophaga aerolata]MDO1448030.1 sigma-70 family RNA polymerase sigma factor [Rhodocytophaga aerolata]